MELLYQAKRTQQIFSIVLGSIATISLLVGGILGIVLGSLIPFLVPRFGHMPTVITWLSLVPAFGISAAVGVAFGLYPACRAAKLRKIGKYKKNVTSDTIAGTSLRNLKEISWADTT